MSLHVLQPKSTFAPARSRSPESLAFEAFWRDLPKDGLVPARSAFHPRDAAQFLRDLLLVEVPPPGARRIKIRLAGSGFEAQVRGSITGHDYLEFLPPPYHDAALQSARLIAGQPCGLWQMTNVHYRRGTSQMLEITAFPLGGGGGRAPLIVALSRGTASFQMAAQIPATVMMADTAQEYAFLDIGAGVPAWDA
ncbi:MAG: PAS domain-containing protein [Alphaproteobacteria bacterium]|nr:PAS domain-containing protein [Alphaproteobacteria bacterium]MBV9693923.1 PAS domain-containing protein [Alphaproteobacteria bacterium]